MRGYFYFVLSLIYKGQVPVFGDPGGVHVFGCSPDLPVEHTIQYFTGVVSKVAQSKYFVALGVPPVPSD